MKTLDSIYKYSPVLLQNLYISAYGLHLKHLRHGKYFSEMLEHLKNSQYYSESDLQSIQQCNLNNLLNHSYKYVPYYKSELRNIGAKPADMSSLNILDTLSITTKKLIRENPALFISSYYKNKQLKFIHTSGTTGTPLKVVATKTSIQNNFAFFSRFLTWAGVSDIQPSATFAGRIIIPSKQNTPPFWRRNISMNNTLYSSYHISESSIPAYIKELERTNVAYIDSYPSSIFSIAQYINKYSIDHNIRPKAIITSSETLHQNQRHAIETAFECKVYDQYGSAEMAAFICQCEEGSYHINPEYGIVEVLDKNNKPTDYGVPGRLVCTGFLNYGMPLIRYDTGDTVVLSDRKCDCGRCFPIVESIVGRTDDLIVTPSGRTIGRLDPVFKGLSSIRETQIVQEKYNKITVNLVKEAGFSSETAETLRNELIRRIGDDVEISINFVDHIPRTKSGKFRSVISHTSQSSN